MTTPIIVAFITGILGPIIVIIVKYYYEKSKNKPEGKYLVWISKDPQGFSKCF